MLLGANEMDQHFKTANFSKNIPVYITLIRLFGTIIFMVRRPRPLVPNTRY